VQVHSRERSLALAGIVAVILMVVGAVVPGSPPKPDDSAAKIARFLVDNGDQIRWAGFIGVLSSIAFLGWLGAVWRLLRRGEGGVPLLAVAAALGAVMAAALFNVASVLLSVMAIIGPNAMGPTATRLFYLLFNNLGSAGAIGLALFVGAFSIVIIETGVLPKAIGWVGALIAIVLLAAGGGVASTRDVFFVLAFIGFIGFGLWTIVVSVMMFRSAEAADAVAPVGAVRSAT
jgi:hypothetical protein